MRFHKVGRHFAAPTGPLPRIYLVDDGWDDFGFQTQYSLIVFQRSAEGKLSEDLIGPVKILKRGQTGGRTQIPGAFNRLRSDYISLGQSLDYYSRINSLPSDLRKAILEGLRDVVGASQLRQGLEREPGWRTSLLRDLDEEEHLQLASAILRSRYTTVASDTGLQFSFQPSSWSSGLDLDFSSSSSADNLLPTRLYVLVGRNGSGKSTLLARLARVAYGTPTSRQLEPLRSLGTLRPIGIGFSRVIAVSFSPFDNFILPGTDPNERKQLSKEVRGGEGRFVFIGLRDLAAEQEAAEPSIGDPFDVDRSAKTRLKPIEKLAAEFDLALERIKQRRRSALFREVLDTLLADPSFGHLRAAGASQVAYSQLASAFMNWSTGHKIALLISAVLVSVLEPRSLVLIDEPETHLHPPLLAALMRVITLCLRKTSAYAVLATHSPVVLQESISKRVKVVRREDSTFAVSAPGIETFGESIGTITSEVFKLHSEATDYHDVLDRLVRRLGKQSDIEALFLDGSMSDQARAYVMTKLAKRR